MEQYEKDRSDGRQPGAPVVDEPLTAAIAERIETEQNLAAALLRNESEYILETFQRYGFSYALIKNLELREFVRRVEVDGEEPNQAALAMGILFELNRAAGQITGWITVLPGLVARLVDMSRREAAQEAAQRIANAALYRNTGTIVAEAAGILALFGSEEAQKNMLLSAPADHEGHAQALLALHPDEFIWTEQAGWLAYDGKCWRREGAKAKVQAAIVDTLTRRRALAAQVERADLVKASRANASTVGGVEELLKHHITANLLDFDNRPELFNANNAVINLRTGEQIEHSPGQRFTSCSPVDYDPDANTAEILAWLRETVQNPEVMVDLLQVAVGYSFTGETREEKFFYIKGESRAGKGTLTELFKAVLCTPLYTETDFSTFTRDSSENPQNFDLAGLRPARIVAASESEKGQHLNPARIKRLTGGNDIRAAFKGRDPFEYTPRFKIWLTSNFDLAMNTDDEAAWNRPVLFIFPNSHLGREDLTLKLRLKTPQNLRAFLKWAVEGARLWYELYSRTGMPKIAEMQAALQAVRDAQDTVRQWLDACTVEDLNSPISTAEAHAQYDEWCKESRIGQPPKGLLAFTSSLKAKGYKVIQKRHAITGKNINHVVGFRIVG